MTKSLLRAVVILTNVFIFFPVIVRQFIIPNLVRTDVHAEPSQDKEGSGRDRFSAGPGKT